MSGYEHPEAVLFAIGDIGVSPHWVVTPNGSGPLRGSSWIGADRSSTSTTIPAWAIILAIVFFLACLLGLLFLLVKETRTTGYFEVTVRTDNLQHTTQVPVSSSEQVAHMRALVAHAQSMAFAA